MSFNSCSGTTDKKKEILICCIDNSLTDSEKESLIERANLGYPIASYRLARYYLNYKKATEEGYYWLEKAAKDGNRLAMYDVANIACGKKNYELALYWYFKLLEPHENRNIMNKIAQIYQTDSQKNMNKARYWYERAARKGDTTAMHKMIEFCSDGKGGEKNTGQAYMWWLVIAKKEKYPTDYIEMKKKVTILSNQLSLSDIENSEKESDILLNQIR
jgi:hypothetical protein